jgi:hypothetical protein
MPGIFLQSDEEYWDGLPLLAHGSAKTYAFFQWPAGLSMRRHVHNPAPGLISHGDCSWVPLPPSEFAGSHHEFLNQQALREAPEFLIDFLFEIPSVCSCPIEPQQYSVLPDHSGCSQHLKRPDVIGRERKTVQFSDPVAWRSKSGVIRRR